MLQLKGLTEARDPGRCISVAGKGVRGWGIGNRGWRAEEGRQPLLARFL